MGLTRVVIAALVTARAVELVKEALPVIPPPWAKSTLASAVGAGAAYIAGERDVRTVAATGLAAAGLAAVVHDVQAALSASADSNITEVMQRVPRRAAPLPTSGGPLGV